MTNKQRYVEPYVRLLRLVLVLLIVGGAAGCLMKLGFVLFLRYLGVV